MSEDGTEAVAYLDEAIAVLKARHINSAQADWPTLEARAMAMIADARTTRDTYPAIRDLISWLGERHTSFWTPERRRQGRAGEDPRTGESIVDETPSGHLVGRIGWVTLPAFGGRDDRAQRYAAVGRAIVRRLDASGVGGWLIDLRGNTGGNMWPMLNAIAGLLGEPPFGYFERPDGTRDTWTVNDGRIGTESRTPPVSLPWKPLENGDAPLAILVGPTTASSGEFTAMSLVGRPETRLFGMPTAGLTTGNSSVDLSDGAAIIMTQTWGQDRTGHRYGGRMIPDEPSENSQEAVDAALAWLASKGCG